MPQRRLQERQTVVSEPEPKIEYKVKKTKNVTIKHVTHTSSWRLESKDDIEKYLEALRKSLLAELDENDIVNVEF